MKIWCEAVQIECANVVSYERLQEGMIEVNQTRSRDVDLAERQRIRVFVTGNSEYADKKQRERCFITFLPGAMRNQTEIILRKHSSMGGIPYTAMSFSIDDGSKKRDVHVVHFDPWTGKLKPNKALSDLSPGMMNTLIHRIY